MINIEYKYYLSTLFIYKKFDFFYLLNFNAHLIFFKFILNEKTKTNQKNFK